MSSCPVSLAAPHELMPALRMLFDHRPDPEGDLGAERCRATLTSNAREPTGVFVARDDARRMCGAALVQALPGALGVAWPPRAGTPEAEDTLVRTALEWLNERGVKVCQAFASADELPNMSPLERNGFRHVTQLVSLRRELDPARDQQRPDDWLDGSFYVPALRDRFIAVLLATHEGTLDCPELEHHRTAEDVVAGFDLPDRPTASHFVAEVGGMPSAISIVDIGPNDALVISYLGVAPAVRGRGIGGKLLRNVLSEACVTGRMTAEVSVDVRNEPALRLYRRHGFDETERREVFLLQLPISDS